MTPPIPAGPEHAPALAAIHAAAFASGSRWDEAALRSLLRLPGMCALVDPDGGFVMARVAADEAEILTLAIVPEWRRQGRARALLGAIMRRSAEAGAAAMFLEVASDSAAALALYAAAAFAPVGRRARYYPDGADALLLRRDLDDLPAPAQAVA